MPPAGPEVEVVGDALPAARVEALVRAAGADDGHVAVSFVGAKRIAALNAEFRGLAGPTDVLSFGVDESGESFGPRELGDVVVCPEHTADLEEAVVHGVLHLLGMDHETDGGEMLARQDAIMEGLR